MHDPLIQFDLVLRHEADGDVSIQKSGIPRPAFENNQGIAIIGRHPRNIAGGSNGLGEIDHQPDLLAVGDAQAKIVVQQIQHSIRVARHAALRVSRPVKTVVAFKGAAEVGLSVGGTETEAATVVVQNQVPLTKKRTGKKLIQRNEGCDFLTAKGYQVTHISVQYK